MTVHKSYLERAGITKGNIYLLLTILSGGGVIEKSHFDSTSSMQAQLTEQTTALALVQQIQGQTDKKLDDLSREVRQLTRAIDRSGLKVTSNP